MELDNQGSNEARSELSDFSDSETPSHEEKKSRKEKGILGAKKKDKEKKKEKEARYATLGDESSGEDEGKKKSKKKGFQFGSAKKEKKEKKEIKDPKEKKEKKDKEKGKLKLKKLKVDADVDGKVKVEDAPVFGVPLVQAVERSRCHDGIKLPVVVRECIDFIEEHGLKVEGIYRSSGVKSKVNKLKIAYNTRKSVSLTNCEPAVVASLLKLFLRELPDPVLTHKLLPKFEEVCGAKETSEVMVNLKRLLDQLPDCNRTLIDWMFVHMGHVIQYEKLNKMSLQNVSIVLSPTMKISHRVLYCLFKHSIPLFGDINLNKYVPPISGQVGVNLLPESPHAIEEEMKKQESLLEDLHREISQGKASKATEEKLWEQQRIVTQLKRKLRLAKANVKTEDTRQDHEEELNFSLQKPASLSSDQGGRDIQVSGGGENKVVSSPDEKDESGQEHRVTVQIHQAEPTTDPGKSCVTVIKLSQNEQEKSEEKSQPPVHIVNENKTTSPDPESRPSSVHTQVVRSEEKPPVYNLGQQVTDTRPAASAPPPPAAASTPLPVASAPPPPASAASQLAGPSNLQGNQNQSKSEDQVDSSLNSETSDAKLETRVEVLPKANINKKVGDYENVDVKHKKVDFRSDEKDGDKTDVVKEDKVKDEFPLLPPPPSSTKPSSRGLLKPVMPQDTKIKSKSLPRGLPSDAAIVSAAPPAAADIRAIAQAAHEEIVVRKPTLESSPGTEDLLWEELRLKYQYEELLNLKSELERKKKMERREIGELHEEIATMQTLYQYRTYSVDSSEDSDVDEEQHQLAEDNRTLLRQLMLEQAELQQKKSFLLDKLETERQVCLKLRVQIRLEQEKLRRRGMLHMS